MKARLPMMLDDPQTSKFAGLDDFEMFETRDEDFFLDGPVSRRVAVLDFDAATGGILPGARFVDPGKRKLGNYDCPAEEGIFGRSFQQVSAFATVLRTIAACAVPGMSNSAAYVAAPLTLSRPSTRLTGCPM